MPLRGQAGFCIIDSFRNRVGVSIASADIPSKVPAAVTNMLEHPGTSADPIDALREQFYNPGSAAEAAGRYSLQSFITRQKAKKGN